MPTYRTSQLLNTHLHCMSDTGRIDCYARAIADVVREGDVAVDVGTGTGILAIMACRAGARKVYAIEPDDIIESARQICAANGLADRIEFLRGFSYEVQIPERADVFIAGHLHNFGLETGLLSSTLDAQRRFLKPDAALIPHSVQLYIAPVELPEKYATSIDFWNSAPCGIDYSILRRLAVNSCHKVNLDPSCLLSEPASLARLELGELKGTFVSGRASFVAARGGVLHGIGGWSSARLSASVTLSTDPCAGNTDWAQIFFPIAEAVSVAEGDRLTCSVDTNDGNTWRWRLETGSGSASRRFEQSTFLSEAISPERLRKRLPLGVPRLSRKGEAGLCLLSLCDGRRTFAEAQEELSSRYGDCFDSPKALSEFVGDFLDRWTV